MYFEYSREPFGAFAERTPIDRQRLLVPEGLDSGVAVASAWPASRRGSGSRGAAS